MSVFPSTFYVVRCVSHSSSLTWCTLGMKDAPPPPPRGLTRGWVGIGGQDLTGLCTGHPAGECRHWLSSHLGIGVKEVTQPAQRLTVLTEKPVCTPSPSDSKAAWHTHSSPAPRSQQRGPGEGEGELMSPGTPPGLLTANSITSLCSSGNRPRPREEGPSLSLLRAPG